ncbi:peptidoglycan-binding protein, partial [Patescibacteria group bacterium]|nr:peptidoglycan-binding protein [Patescibacteria group bacterium]
QNSDYKSPLRANWLEVDSEITSEKTFRLKLKSSYNSFLENCTLKIIPKHIWESILPENFALSFYNLQPVGSGPYKFYSIRQTDTGFINSLTLKANNNYYQKETNIGEIVFKFFEGKDELAKAASRREIDSFSSTLLLDNNLPRGFTTYSFSAPRYFAVFLNNQMTDLFPKKVRDALNYATDKQDLINQLTSSLLKKYNTDSLSIADSPVLPEFFGYDPSVPPVYDLEEAENLLDSAGFIRNEEGFRVKNIDKKPAFQFKSTLKTGSTGNEVTELQKCLLSDPEVYQGDVTGYFGSATKDAVTKLQKKYLPELDSQYWGSVGKSTRAKLNEMCTPPAQNTLPLSIEITTVNQTMMVKTAEILKGQWEKAGISTSIRALNIQDLKPIIKSREYEALLYGEALGIEPDLYPFWHSSQKIDPGLNLAVYSNDKVDSLLKEARETLDKEREGECYEQIQILIIADAPAIFLYNSAYLYSISTAIKGVDAEKLVDPSKRFANIETWFIKTKRAWK